MIIIRPLDIKEKTAYNNVVKHPLQTWEWGDFRRKTGVEVERFGLFDGQMMVGGMQVTFHPIPHTPYTVGYFPKGQMPDEEQLHALFDLGRRKNALFIKLEPNVASAVDKPQAHETLQNFLQQNGAVPGRPLFTKYTFVLDLKPTEEVLLEHMKPKTRYNLHLAERRGVQVVQDDSDEAIEEYLRILHETTNRQQFYAHGPEYFRTMWQTLKPTGMIHIFRAVLEGKTLVAWIVFVHNNVLYYPYGASSNENREVMASNMMMWKVIQFGKQQGCTSFDMWGSLGPDADPTNPWYGFHKFKEGYGGVLTEFMGTYDLLVMPQYYKIYRFLEELRWKLLRFRAKFLKT
ncbi:MAG: peptidoglycan bridge formation glycyltransferase FemA/FemB family protein [Candidatus Pacebacteria bacterium]|nr:peptidoglycan bridge formation glycyltransferase FemA/FemB family protein [Candidatus Paceibacterota bacterium]